MDVNHNYLQKVGCVLVKVLQRARWPVSILVPLEPLNNIFCASVCLPFKNLNISIHQMSGLQFWQVLIGSCNSEYPLFWDGIQNGFSFHDNLTVYYCPTDVPTRHRIKDVIFFRAQIPKSSSVLRPIVFAILRWARLGR